MRPRTALLQSNDKLTTGKLTESEVYKAEAPGFKLWTRKQIEHDQDGIFQSVKDLDDRIKANALQCIAHAKQHGDVTLMDRLIDRLPKGYLDAGFRQWMYRNSPIRLDTNGHLKQIKEGEPGYKPYNVENAKEESLLKTERNVGANAAERKFGLDNVINLYAGVRKRFEKADERGEVVESDRKAILKVMNAEEAALSEVKMNLPKAARTVSVADEAEEEALKKAKASKSKLIVRRRKPVARKGSHARMTDKVSAAA